MIIISAAALLLSRQERIAIDKANAAGRLLMDFPFFPFIPTSRTIFAWDDEE